MAWIEDSNQNVSFARMANIRRQNRLQIREKRLAVYEAVRTLVARPCSIKHSRSAKVAFMEWTCFTDGEFAKCKHGY
jgi:hypothetical protein